MASSAWATPGRVYSGVFDQAWVRSPAEEPTSEDSKGGEDRDWASRTKPPRKTRLRPDKRRSAQPSDRHLAPVYSKT